jgi:hypothetical protein
MSIMSTGLGDEERKSGAGGRRGGLGHQWDDHDAFTVEEAGKILGLSRASAFAAAKRGDVPTIRIGKRLIVPRRALERLLGIEADRPADLQVTAAPPAPAPQRVEVAIQVTAPPRGSGRSRKHPPAPIAAEEATTAI